MHSAKTKAELQQHKSKLANSYSELLKEFSAHHLRHVGNYTVGKLIGKGSFGKVYLARHNLTNSKVVLKSSKKDDANLAREIHHHRQFIHPHIARLYEVIVTESAVWLVLEYCAGDELYHHLVQTGPLPVETVQKIFTQLVGAVAYIHSKSCVHRDLKLENVLLDNNENVKLCDFGFTREYEGKSNYLSTFCGTVCYSAPEMLKGEKYAGEKVDVWSLGVILFALLKGELPFDEDDDQITKAKILKDEPTFPDTFPEAAKSLVLKLLSKRPLYRPTLSEILADPFLAEYAPQQQATLKLSQPSPFTTPLEKSTLERMRSAGVDIDKVIENVLSQRCDSLAGWWALLIEKEQKKEARREKKRKEKEAELRLLRRLSAASSRLDKIALEDVAEEGSKAGAPSSDRNRSSSRGRTQRRSTPQILVTDLPRLPEGSAIETPHDETAPVPPPIDKDPVRSRSGSRPPIPPKEKQRRSSHLQIVTANPDLLNVPTNGNKRRRGKKDKNFLHSWAAIKHWFMDTARLPKSPKKNALQQPVVEPTTQTVTDSAPIHKHSREFSNASAQTRSSYGTAMTPIGSNFSGQQVPRLETNRVRPRNSVSPITPSRAAYRHSGMGLKGRKSTSSSVSSVRSMHRHSKASSVSSNSIDTINSPSRSAARSPHSSVKVLPTTPTLGAFPSGIRFARDSGGELSQQQRDSFHDGFENGQMGVMFARRKKSPFKGPSLNSSLFANPVMQGQLSPMIRPRELSSGRPNLGLLDTRRSAPAKQRKSQIIEEEEEEEEEEGDEDEEAVEEVEEFSPIDLRRGESVHSILVWDDPPDDGEGGPSHSHDRGPITAAQLREINERVEREKASIDAHATQSNT